MVAKRIKKVRGGRSQAEFAYEIDVFQQNISRNEQGTTPHLDFIILLSIKEKISIEWLLFGSGDMRRSRRV